MNISINKNQFNQSNTKHAAVVNLLKQQLCLNPPLKIVLQNVLQL